MSIQPNKIKQNGGLAGLFDVKAREIARSINCVEIGTIQEFNAETQTATVKINFKRMINNELRDYSALVDVPCVVLNGGGGGITFPIKGGDVCVLLFNDRNIDNWFATGAVMQPDTTRTHDLSDAIALVGINSLATSIKDYLTSGVKIWYNGAQIKLEDGSITITDGQGVVSLQNGNITVTGQTMTVNAPAVTFSGNVAVSGSLMQGGKDVGANHTHGGVYPGSGNTGGVN